MIGRLHHIVIDCPDPVQLAEFYRELLGWPITWQEQDFVVVARDDTASGVAFQLASQHQAPNWPDPRHPQQIHLDVMVDDLQHAAKAVTAIGATALRTEADGQHVFADPAGHPFCLIPRPGWAPPVLF